MQRDIIPAAPADCDRQTGQPRQTEQLAHERPPIDDGLQGIDVMRVTMKAYRRGPDSRTTLLRADFRRHATFINDI